MADRFKVNDTVEYENKQPPYGILLYKVAEMKRENGVQRLKVRRISDPKQEFWIDAKDAKIVKEQPIWQAF